MKLRFGSTAESTVSDLDKPCDRDMRDSGTVCAAYIRTNKVNSEGSMSLASQEEALRIVAAENGVEALEMFTDIGVKANWKEKPALQELLELGHAGRLGHLLVTDWTRFSRDPAEAVTVIAKFRSYGVHIAFFRGDPSTFHIG